MFKLFTPGEHAVQKQPGYIDIDYQRTLMSIMLLTEYYGKAGYRVKNDHILVKLIELLMSSYEDTGSFMRDVMGEVNSDSVGILGIGTRARSGKVISDPFLGGLNQCMLYIDDSTNVTAPPVEVCWHPHTLVNLPILDGNMPLLDIGINTINVATYTINVTSLMLRYKQYLKYTSGELASIAHYIYSKVLPGMFTSFYHLSLWNRMMASSTGIPVINAPNRHRLKTIQLTNSNIPGKNTKTYMKEVNIPSYEVLLNWQIWRGYAGKRYTMLPAGVDIYRHTASFAWLSRGDFIKGLILLGGKQLADKQGQYFIDLEYQLRITTNGKFITDGQCNTWINPKLEMLRELLHKYRG